jgi:pyruvate dehydrogenase E2 component (dihydrolipoamide acetyltransferase)
MKAVALTIREFPQFNSSLDEEKHELVTKHYYNIGFAADTNDGLMVPNVKNVEVKNILQIAKDISDLAEKARHGKLAPDDMKNGTITITNIGSIGGLYATPIINPPEVAIIGIYEIVKKPVVINDEVVVRQMMNVTATCDHRIVDGADAARFLKKLKTRLAYPAALLLEMI